MYIFTFSSCAWIISHLYIASVCGVPGLQEKFPKARMDVFVTVLEDDGSCEYGVFIISISDTPCASCYKSVLNTLSSRLWHCMQVWLPRWSLVIYVMTSCAGVAAALTAASLALADAGIHMYDVVIGSTIVSIISEDTGDHLVILTGL